MAQPMRVHQVSWDSQDTSARSVFYELCIIVASACEKMQKFDKLQHHCKKMLHLGPGLKAFYSQWCYT